MQKSVPYRRIKAQKSASNFDAIFRKKFKELKDDQESKGNSRRDLPRDGRVGKDQRVGAVSRTTSEGKDR